MVFFVSNRVELLELSRIDRSSSYYREDSRIIAEKYKILATQMKEKWFEMMDLIQIIYF